MRFSGFVMVALFALAAVSCQENPAAVSDQPFEAGGGTVRLAGLGDCTRPSTSILADEMEANLKASVSENGTVSFEHSGAVFNCCMDSVGLEMYSWGSILRVVEREFCAEPCRCICGYKIHGEISDLEPGYYTLEICEDSLATDALCSVQFKIGG